MVGRSLTSWNSVSYYNRRWCNANAGYVLGCNKSFVSGVDRYKLTRATSLPGDCSLRVLGIFINASYHGDNRIRTQRPASLITANAITRRAVLILGARCGATCFRPFPIEINGKTRAAPFPAYVSASAPPPHTQRRGAPLRGVARRFHSSSRFFFLFSPIFPDFSLSLFLTYISILVLLYAPRVFP